MHYGDYKPVKIDLWEASDEELVEYQLHENEWFARTARRLIQERAAEGKFADAALGELLEIWAQQPSLPIKLRALWSMHATGKLNAGKLASNLGNPSEIARGWIVRLLGETDRSDWPDLTNLAAGEESPFVRRQLASLLTRIPEKEAWKIAENLASHAEDANDALIPLLIWYGIEPLVAKDPVRAFQLAKTTKIPKLRDFIFRRVAAIPGGHELTLEKVEDAATAQIVIGALAAQLQDETRLQMPKSWPRVYEMIREHSNPEVQRNALILAGRFGDKRLLPEFRRLLTDTRAPMPMRLAALGNLVEARDAETVPILHRLAKSPGSPLRNRAISSLATLNATNSAQILLDAYPDYGPIDKPVAITTLTSRPDFAKALLEAVGSGTIPRGDVSVVAARQISQFGDEALDAALEKHWGKIKPANKDKTAAMASWRTKLSREELAKANPGNGRRVFNQTCFACHTMFGQGIAIGPDITGANRSDLNYLLENIVDPNNVVPIDYQLTVFTNKDGGVVSGMVRTETNTAVSVALPGGAEVSIPKTDIASRQTQPLSLMPEGILEALSLEDARDLIAYLQAEKQVRIAEPGVTLIEGESMRVVQSTGRVRPQPMGQFKLDSWSGDSQLWWTNARPGDRLVLAFDAPEDGEYALSAVLTKAHDYGQVRLKLNGGANLLSQVDLYEPPRRVVTTGELALGAHELDEGTHHLAIDILGRNPKAAPGFMFGIDCLKLVKR